MREWKSKRIINEKPSCTLCPCKMGLYSQVWRQSTVSLWHRAPCAPVLYLGNFFPRFSLFLTVSSWSNISAFLHALHKLQAPSFLPNSHLWGFLFACWYFVCLFVLEVFYLLKQAVSTTTSLLSFLTKYTFPVFQKIPHDTGTPPFKGNRTGKPGTNGRDITHQRIYTKL